MKTIVKRLLPLFLVPVAIASFVATTSPSCGMFPASQVYPYESESVVTARADQLSSDMTAYIKDWAAGRVPALMPRSVLPEGCFYNDIGMNTDEANKPNPEFKDIKLVNPDAVSPSTYMIHRPEQRTIDWQKIQGLYSDPHCAYTTPLIYLEPFNSTTTITGQFPYCRYFSIQVSPPFDPRFYYHSSIGVLESTIVDVDIDADSGSVNPFRIGQNRTATNRNYAVTLRSAKGRWADLMPNLTQPNLRMAGNMRYSSGIQYQGPGIHGRPDGKGMFHCGQIYIRYYAPDKSKNTSAGVPLPKMSSQLSTGEKFLIVSDFDYKNKFMNCSMVAPTTNGEDPKDYANGTVGWRKNFSVPSSGWVTAHIQNNWTSAADKKYIRDFILGVEARHYNQPSIGSWESGASLGNHIHYLVRDISLNSSKVIALSGKLPTYPGTRNGETANVAANMRFMSFMSYFGNINISGPDPNQPSGCPMTSVMDDDLVLDANRNYVICYSRATEKPTNATSAAKVTWVSYGPVSVTGWMWRWIAVGPEWTFNKTPDQNNLSMRNTFWASEYYDPNKIGKNDHSGFLGEFQPKVHYMTKSDFESLGTPVTETKLNTKSWGGSGCGSRIGASATGTGAIVLLPLLIMVALGMYGRKNRNS